MEWVIAILLVLNFSVVLALFWFWKWSLQRMHELEAQIVRLKYQERVREEADQKELWKKELARLAAEIEALQRFKESSLPLIEQVRSEPRFESSQQEMELRRLIQAASTVEPLPVGPLAKITTPPSLKNLFSA